MHLCVFQATVWLCTDVDFLTHQAFSAESTNKVTRECREHEQGHESADIRPERCLQMIDTREIHRLQLAQCITLANHYGFIQLNLSVNANKCEIHVIAIVCHKQAIRIQRQLQQTTHIKACVDV